MEENDPVQYQGIIIAQDEEQDAKEAILYNPSQLGEFEKYIHKGYLSDGKSIIKSRWLDGPIDRKAIDIAVLELMIG